MVSKEYIESVVDSALRSLTNQPFRVEALIEEEDGELSVAVDVIGLHRDIALKEVVRVLTREGMGRIEAISPTIIEPETGVRVYSIYEKN